MSYEKRMPGENVLVETQHEANKSVDRKRRYSQIIEILSEAKEPLSAKEIAVEMFKRGYASTSERNLSAPRICEMLKKGVVENAGKKLCEYTNHHVGVFELRNNG